MRDEGACENADDTYDKILNLTMIVIFSIEILLHSCNSVKSLKKPENRNIYNIVEYVSTFGCLTTHICYLIYSQSSDYSCIYPQMTLHNYFSFQLTFDLLNFSVIAKFFQWVEVS